MITTARTKEGVIPRYRANPSFMSLHCLHYFGFSCIPYLEVSCVRSDSELIAIAGPLNAGYPVIWTYVA